jgi:hypothetical protein
MQTKPPDDSTAKPIPGAPGTKSEFRNPKSAEDKAEDKGRG